MIKWTPKSEKDLENILIYITKNFDIDLATVIVYGMIDYTEITLTKNPLVGRLLASNPFFSKLVHKGNSIYYCENPTDKNLYIVYVQARQMKYKPSRLNDDELA